MSTRHADPAFATTLAHGFAVLHCFRFGEAALSNKALAERTGLSKATISRLTDTLLLRGLLQHDVQARRYRLGPAVLHLGYPLLADLKVRQLARPAMTRLARYAGGSVSLGMRERMHMVYVETCRGHDAIAFRPDIGGLLPMLSTAMGRAWLAQAGEDERAALLDKLREAHPEQYRHQMEILARERERLARNGFCASDGEWHSDIHAVAVPLPVRIHGNLLVFNCGVPIRRLDRHALHDRVAPRLVRLVSRVARTLESAP